jgi:hypothetical protein
VSSSGAEFSIFVTPGLDPPPLSYTSLGTGYLAAGSDCGSGTWTVAEAEAQCTAVAACVGFTFASNVSDPVSSTEKLGHAWPLCLVPTSFPRIHAVSLCILPQPAPVFVYLKSEVAFTAAAGWQAYGSDRDVGGVRLAAAGALLPDGRSVTLSTVTQRAGQVVSAAAYGWATWPVATLFDRVSGAPAIPWYVLANASSEL